MEHLQALFIGILIIGALVTIIGVIAGSMILALHYAGGWGLGAVVLLLIAYGLGSIAMDQIT